MSINLTPYKFVQTSLFVRIDCLAYKATLTDTPRQEILRFSDCERDVTLNGEVYLGLGRLVGITETVSELRATGNDLSISLSGIPDSALSEIVYSRIKGSKVTVYRAFFDQLGALLPITGNPTGRYWGVVSNYTLDEDYDVESRKASNNITFTCSNVIDQLGNKVTGRRTNPLDQKKVFSGDISFDRVPALTNANFNFGAPK
jgi:hypothetical protein